MNPDKTFLGTQPVGKLLLKLAIPSVIAQIVNMLYNIVDRIYIGHIPETGSLALTGLGVCMPLILIVSAFAAFAGQGGAPLFSMARGEGDEARAGRIMGNSMLMLLFFALFCTIAGYLVKTPLLRLFGASDDTIGFADRYIRIYLCGTVFVQLALGQMLPLCKRGNKAGQRALEFFLNQIVDLKGLRLFLGNKRGHKSVLILQDSPLAKPLDDRVGCRSLPSKLLQAQLCKLRRSDRLMLP